MRLRTLTITITVAAVLAAFGFVGYRYYVNHQSQSSSPSPAGQIESPAATPQSPTKTYPVKVYFSKHPDSDDDPAKVFAVSRSSQTLGVGAFSITELLKGPTTTEAAAGYFTTARLRAGTSTCDGQNFRLAITQGVATLTFCKPFDHLGVVADGQADSEIKATLKQFPTVQKVIILNSQGDCEFNLSGMNLCKQ